MQSLARTRKSRIFWDFAKGELGKLLKKKAHFRGIKDTQAQIASSPNLYALKVKPVQYSTEAEANSIPILSNEIVASNTYLIIGY